MGLRIKGTFEKLAGAMSLHQKNKLMSNNCAQIARQVQVLTGKVLVNKEDFHGWLPRY